MRIELSIKTTYLHEWRTGAGVREMVQNAFDAQTQFKAPMKIWHNNHVLKIENKGVSLPHEALLLGHTTKEDDQATIGHFGEGLKLGALALVRAGHTVVIRSGEEIWKPVLVRSASYRAEVLAFDISKSKDCGGVVVEIDKIPYAEWLEMRKNFLFLQDGVEKVSVDGHGDLLLSKDMVGKVFVKGIFVQHEPKFHAGYNLLNAPTDRDRKVIASYDLGWRLGVLWAKAVGIRPDLGGRLYDMAAFSAPDTESIGDYAHFIPEQARPAILARFHDSFGKDAVPVADLAESKDLAHFGRKGVVLPRPLARMLQRFMGMEGGIEGVKKALGTAISAHHSWLDLSEEQRGNLEWAIGMVASAGVDVPMSVLDIVSFQSATRQGLWNGKKVCLSMSALDSRDIALVVLVHECAHRSSEKGDGEKGHVAEIERIWSGIVASLLKEGR
jgi:hypothetical protein